MVVLCIYYRAERGRKLRENNCVWVLRRETAGRIPSPSRSEAPFKVVDDGGGFFHTRGSLAERPSHKLIDHHYFIILRM